MNSGKSSGRHVLVMAKAPVAGRVKTRLCPPLSPAEAAQVAEASLAQTLEAVAGCSAARKLVALDGVPGDWLPPGFNVFAQRGLTFNARLANAWSDAGGPGVQIGMDTPQVTPQLLDRCLYTLDEPSVSAALGLAVDGGWWALGLDRSWDLDVFTGVEMSVATTGQEQLARLEALGHQVSELPRLRDIDTVSDAICVAQDCPDSGLAELLASLLGPLAAAS